MTPSRGASDLNWIRQLAAPYLRGYRAQRWRHGMDGYYFLARLASDKRKQPAGSKPGEAGFFVGYVHEEIGFSFLNVRPPECIVFACVTPPQWELYQRLVAPEDSLFRRTFHYIRWLTHRPPRFVFHPDQMCVLTRHRSMTDWPPEKREHYSRNFFIETLAWLVRSGLVRKLAEEAAKPPIAARRRPRKETSKLSRTSRHRS